MQAVRKEFHRTPLREGEDEQATLFLTLTSHQHAGPIPGTLGIERVVPTAIPYGGCPVTQARKSTAFNPVLAE